MLTKQDLQAIGQLIQQSVVPMERKLTNIEKETKNLKRYVRRFHEDFGRDIMRIKNHLKLPPLT